MVEVIRNKIIEFIKKAYEKPSIADNPSCYVYDLDIIKENVGLIQAYAPPQISLYYAMKANPNKNIMSCVRKLDYISGVEIASSGELTKALEFFKPNEVIFTGPGKTEKELELSLQNNIRLINVESVVEAIRINTIAERLNLDKVDILLRINVNYHISHAQEYMAGCSTKMGIDEDKYIESYSVIGNLNRINIKGIHVFGASGVLEYKSLIKYANYVFQLVSRLEETTTKIDIIDFGGGIGIDYTEKNRLFGLRSYFEELSQLIDQYGFSDKEIIMELGTYIVGNAGFYTSKIIDIKEIKKRKHIILAGGINHMGLPFEMKRKHPVHILHMNCNKLYENQPIVYKEQTDISGPICMSSDKLSWDEYIEKAEIGDIVIYRQAGAYCYSLGMLEFLGHPYPEELCIQSNDTRGSLIFQTATEEDFQGMLAIENEFFGTYSRALNEENMTRWFNHNPNMFYVVKNENGHVLAFTILVPVTKELYDKLKKGKVSDLFDFDENEVEKVFKSDYFFIEEVCVSKKGSKGNYFRATRLLFNEFTKIIYENAKFVTTSPITEDGKRICEHLGFQLVAEEVYEGKKYSVCELVNFQKTREEVKRVCENYKSH